MDASYLSHFCILYSHKRANSVCIYVCVCVLRCCDGVNACRRMLYTKKNRAIENIPPTADALLQHTKRAALQARIWSDCLLCEAPNLLPAQWGWKLAEDGGFEPL